MGAAQTYCCSCHRPDATLVLDPLDFCPAALAGWCTDRLYEAGIEYAAVPGAATPQAAGNALAVAVCLGYCGGTALAQWLRVWRQMQVPVHPIPPSFHTPSPMILPTLQTTTLVAGTPIGCSRFKSTAQRQLYHVSLKITSPD